MLYYRRLEGMAFRDGRERTMIKVKATAYGVTMEKGFEHMGEAMRWLRNLWNVSWFEVRDKDGSVYLTI